MGGSRSKEGEGAYLPPYSAVNDWVLVLKVSVLRRGGVWLNEVAQVAVETAKVLVTRRKVMSWILVCLYLE